MRLSVYTVYDKAVNAFMQPFYARSTGEAIRSFTELANDKNTNVGRHPTDFVLFGLGEFDDNSGLFHTVEPMRLLAANEVLELNSFMDMQKDIRRPPPSGNGQMTGKSSD